MYMCRMPVLVISYNASIANCSSTEVTSTLPLTHAVWSIDHGESESVGARARLIVVERAEAESRVILTVRPLRETIDVLSIVLYLLLNLLLIYHCTQPVTSLHTTSHFTAYSQSLHCIQPVTSLHTTSHFTEHNQSLHCTQPVTSQHTASHITEHTNHITEHNQSHHCTLVTSLNTYYVTCCLKWCDLCITSHITSSNKSYHCTYTTTLHA